jgi:large subunit ribosomal protein L31
MHHHYALGFFGRVDWTFMGLNTLMLALHRLHPLPDGRARGHVRAGEVRGTATLFYAATFFVTGVVTNIAWRYAASGRRLIEGRVADSEPLMALASAWAPIAICAALAVLYAFPARYWLGSARRWAREAVCSCWSWPLWRRRGISKGRPAFNFVEAGGVTQLVQPRRPYSPGGTDLTRQPTLFQATVRCTSCGTTFETSSTRAEIVVDVCSSCHPAYTGRERTTASSDRVQRFNRRRALARQAA